MPIETMSSTPSNDTAVFASTDRAPAAANVGLPWYAPSFTPFSSRATVPDASPRRQYDLGPSPRTVDEYPVPQRCHLDANDNGVDPDHCPCDTDSNCPTCAVPDTTGTPSS